MKLNEAKYILESTGFTVKNTESSFDKAVSSLMESMEARNATGTKAYSILSEMARFRGKYVDSFAGLEDAGTVSVVVAKLRNLVLLKVHPRLKMTLSLPTVRVVLRTQLPDLLLTSKLFSLQCQKLQTRLMLKN